LYYRPSGHVTLLQMSEEWNLYYSLPLDLQKKIYIIAVGLIEEQWQQEQEDLWDNEQEIIDDSVRQYGYYCGRCRIGTCDEH